MRSTVFSVRIRRLVHSPGLMSPRSRAATVDQRCPPILVGEVYRERSAAASDAGMLSAARPVVGSVMATRLRHVSAAHPCTRAGSRADALADRTYAGAPKTLADARLAVRPTAAAALTPTRSWRRVGVETAGGEMMAM